MSGHSGQGLVEYGLILAITSVLTAVWLVVFGGTVSDALTAIGIAIDRATGRLTGYRCTRATFGTIVSVPPRGSPPYIGAALDRG